MFQRLLDRLKPKAHVAPVQSETQTPLDDSLITVFDAYGQELRITRNEWRDKVLLPNLTKEWNSSDELYQLILSGLNDGFVDEVADASFRLLEIDTIPERSHVVRSIVLMKLQEFDGATAILNAAIDKLGPSGTLLTNLAKVEAERGDQARADDLLWRAIQLDPNQDNGLMWWVAIQQERNGDHGYVQALEKAAELPGSWLPQLWLARRHLESGDVPAARDLYQGVLDAGNYSSESLMMISGDLGNNNQVPMIIDLVAPVFDTQRHDPRAGMNLVRAYLQLGRRQEGEALLSRLYAMNLPPYKQHLDQLSGELQRLEEHEFTAQSVDPEQMQITTVPFDRPIWMYGLREPKWLFAPKSEDAKRVLFLSFSKRVAATDAAEQQREDDVGRLSRALPLYLAEAVHYWTGHQGHTFIPIIQGAGPVVFGDGGSDVQTVEKFAEHGDFAVLGTIDDFEGRRRISCRLWNCATVECIATEEFDVPAEKLGAAALDLEMRLLARLGGPRQSPHDPFYLRPSADAMDPYLTGLGQNLLLTLLANDLVSRDGLWGERNLIEWPLRMALQWPGAEMLKIMYLSGVSKAASYGSALLPEFKARTLELIKDCRNIGSPVARLEPVVWSAFGMTAELQHAQEECNERADGEEYCEWLGRLAVGDSAEVAASAVPPSH